MSWDRIEDGWRFMADVNAEVAERYLGVGAAVDAAARHRAIARHAALMQGLERILKG